MTNLSLHPNIIKLEAKSAQELEDAVNSIRKAFTPLAFYGMNGRHYAWLSMHQGVKKKVVKVKTKITENKQSKVKI